MKKMIDVLRENPFNSKFFFWIDCFFVRGIIESDLTLPIPNPLHAYATYDYIIGIGCLSPDQFNYPGSSYMAGDMPPLICKSAKLEFSLKNKQSTVFNLSNKVKIYFSLNILVSNSICTNLL